MKNFLRSLVKETGLWPHAKKIGAAISQAEAQRIVLIHWTG